MQSVRVGDCRTTSKIGSTCHCCHWLTVAARLLCVDHGARQHHLHSLGLAHSTHQALRAAPACVVHQRTCVRCAHSTCSHARSSDVALQHNFNHTPHPAQPFLEQQHTAAMPMAAVAVLPLASVYDLVVQSEEAVSREVGEVSQVCLITQQAVPVGAQERRALEAVPKEAALTHRE
jgi:hypothetical protein